MFVIFGGVGSILLLVIVMLLICKSKCIKLMGKLLILLGIFGINELLIFGLLIMFNLILLILFVIVLIINIIIVYFCMLVGLVFFINGV